MLIDQKLKDKATAIRGKGMHDFIDACKVITREFDALDPKLFENKILPKILDLVDEVPIGDMIPENMPSRRKYKVFDVWDRKYPPTTPSAQKSQEYHQACSALEDRILSELKNW